MIFNDIEYKKCKKCNNTRRLSLFYDKKSNKDGKTKKCKLCVSAEMKEKYVAAPDFESTVDREESKLKQRLRLYGITKSKYLRMEKKQNGCCYICKKSEKDNKKKLAIDHCHKSGKVRALLCGSCNRALGLVRENIDTVRAMIKYLRKYKKYKDVLPPDSTS